MGKLLQKQPNLKFQNNKSLSQIKEKLIPQWNNSQMYNPLETQMLELQQESTTK
jgi:hypothetical protein